MKGEELVQRVESVTWESSDTCICTDSCRLIQLLFSMFHCLFFWSSYFPLLEHSFNSLGSGQLSNSLLLWAVTHPHRQHHFPPAATAITAIIFFIFSWLLIRWLLSSFSLVIDTDWAHNSLSISLTETI